jgi:hypothetical protein
MWLVDEIVAAAASAMAAEERRVRTEQTYRGPDGLDEVGVHAVLAAGFERAGWGVVREERFPGAWRKRPGRRSTLPEARERERCDLVLTPRRGQGVRDAMAAARGVDGARKAAAGGLFEAAAGALGEADFSGGCDGATADGRVPASDAYWLEVKVVGQFTYTLGVPGPNRTYASELLRGVPADLKKLAADPAVVRGGVLLVLFTTDQLVAEHDLALLVHRCLDRRVPLRSPRVEGVAVADRIGNGRCTLALFEPAAGGVEEGGASGAADPAPKQRAKAGRAKRGRLTP